MTPDLSSYLRLAPIPVAIEDGLVVHIRPATVADAVAWASACPEGTDEVRRLAWLVWNHLVDDQGRRLFDSPDQAAGLDYRFVAKVKDALAGMYDPK